ncbi:MAG: alpha/beta fold hydrolase [Pseudomonadota bacterium]
MRKKLLVLALLAAALIVSIAATVYFVFPEKIIAWAIDRERGKAGLTKKNVQVGDHLVTYLEGGRGDVVVLMHGFGGDKDNWTRFAAFLTPRYRVIALDLPGFGESDFRPSASYAYSEQARRLDQFASAVGLDRFHLAGNSMGGHVSGRYAVEHPRRVRTLGLFASGGVKSPRDSEVSAIIQKGEANPLVVAAEEDFPRLMNFIFFAPPALPSFLHKALVRKTLARQEQNRTIFRQIALEHLALQPDLNRIEAPTLILWGDHDRVLDPSGAEVFSGLIKNSRKEIMKNCGHVPMIERPGEAARIYLTFLENK